MLDTTANAPRDDDATETMTEIMRHAFWTIAYHETELPKAHRKAANTNAILQRAGLLIELAEARKAVEAMDNEEDAKNVQQFAAALLVDAADSIDYHEKNIIVGHTKLAHAKAMMRRCGLDLPLANIEAKARERARA